MNNDALKHDILMQALKDIPFDGWNIDTFRRSAEILSHDRMIVDALFPQGIHDTLKYFSNWADEETIRQLQSISRPQRIRDQVALAIETRIDILSS